MAYWTLTDLENVMGPKTVMTIFDDLDTGVINDDAVTSLQARCDSEVNSYIATNYPRTLLPIPQNPVPDTVKFASLEFAVVFARDRQVEYWSKQQEGERTGRLREAREKMIRLLQGEQYLFDLTVEPKPSTVGGVVIDIGPRTISPDADGTDNGGDF